MGLGRRSVPRFLGTALSRYTGKKKQTQARAEVKARTEKEKEARKRSGAVSTTAARNRLQGGTKKVVGH